MRIVLVDRDDRDGVLVYESDHIPQVGSYLNTSKGLFFVCDVMYQVDGQQTTLVVIPADRYCRELRMKR